MTFTLPELPYAYDALGPYMSKETLEFHHDKHHKAYVDTGNKLLEGTDLQGKSVEEIVKAAYNTNQPLFNNAGQHYNHIHFWKWMKKGGGGKSLPGALQKAIDSDLGGYDKFRTDFINAGVGQFGSGWAWLVKKSDGSLGLASTIGAGNPMTAGDKPLLTCDVWEHAYYIDQMNKRPAYVKAVLENLINWDFASENFARGTAWTYPA